MKCEYIDPTPSCIGKSYRIEKDENHLGAGIKKGDIFECTGFCRWTERPVLKYPKGWIVIGLEYLTEV